MHIAEGFLPVGHAVGWTAVSMPFFAHGIYRLRCVLRRYPNSRLLLATSAAFIFVLSALKLPSITGSSSHPTGVGLGTVLFGPSVMAPLGTMVLLFQALLLAHGGLTTLGANAFSMAIAGPCVASWVFGVSRKCRASLMVAAFLAGTMGDWATYLTTAAQLALAFPDAAGGFAGSFVKFGSVFAITQIPLAIVEGLVTALVVDLLISYSRPELVELSFIKEPPDEELADCNGSRSPDHCAPCHGP